MRIIDINGVQFGKCAPPVVGQHVQHVFRGGAVPICSARVYPGHIFERLREPGYVHIVPRIGKTPPTLYF